MAAGTLDSRVQLRLTKHQWERVQALAFAMDIPVSAVVRHSIDHFFDRLEALPDDELAAVMTEPDQMPPEFYERLNALPERGILR